MDTIKCEGCEKGHHVNKYGIHESYTEPSSICERNRGIAEPLPHALRYPCCGAWWEDGCFCAEDQRMHVEE
jgi:hypothetical protein